MTDSFYWVDTGWGCGGIHVRAGIIVGPTNRIFRKWLGSPIENFLKRHAKDWVLIEPSEVAPQSVE